MSTDENNWRTPQFRQSVIAKIDEAIQRSGMPTPKKGSEMENHVFQKAKTKEEYLGFVARLILHVRELSQGNNMLGGLAPPPGPQQPTQPNPEMFMQSAQCMNRPVLQHKLTPQMQTKAKPVRVPRISKKESTKETDPWEYEFSNVDLTTAATLKKRTFTEMCRDACVLLRNVSKKLDARDEFQIFGEHVAMKLRCLKSETAKNAAQYYISKILFDAVSGKFDAADLSKEEDIPNLGGSSSSSPQSTASPSQHPVTRPLATSRPSATITSVQGTSPIISPPLSSKASTSSESVPIDHIDLSNSPLENFTQLSDIYNLSYDDFL